MDIEKILKLNKRGIVPGPGESETAFEERAHYCLGLKDSLEEALGDNIPFSAENTAPHALDSAFEHTEACYGIQPDWVPVFFSNAKLTPWHGGCAWIFQMDEQSPTSAFLQLRKSFYSSEKYLGLLQRDEVLAHESSHIGRMCFQEPKFEEFIAYQSSSSSWRRWLGPLVQSTGESMLFIGILLLILVLDLFFLYSGDFDSYEQLMLLKLMPLVLIGLGIIRLIIRHQTLGKCRKVLSLFTSNPLIINAIIYRLTDQEILSFGKMDKKSLMDYMKKEEKDTLRWRVIKRGYLYEHFVHSKPIFPDSEPQRT